MLPNSSSSDVSFKHGSKQTSTHSKGVSTETIDYPENEVINILEKIKLAKDSTDHGDVNTNEVCNTYKGHPPVSDEMASSCFSWCGLFLQNQQDIVIWLSTEHGAHD